MKKQNIEVEGGELLIMSDEGHYAVIPSKHRQEVIDMVKDGCDDCINNYIQTLPRDSDYAEDGSLIPDDKRSYASSTTNVDISNSKYKDIKRLKLMEKLPPHILKADIRNKIETDKQIKYNNDVDNPEILTPIEYLQKPLKYIADPNGLLRHMANPLKAIGDITNTFIPNSNINKDLPNTKNDVLEYRRVQANPNITSDEKFKHSINTALDLTQDAILNVAIPEFGYLSPALTNSARAARVLKTASIANNVNNTISIARDIPKLIEKGTDAELSDFFDIAVNAVGLSVKVRNTNTGDSISNLLDPNFRNTFRSLSTADKKAFIINIGKDITAHGLNAQDQINRPVNNTIPKTNKDEKDINK